MNFFNPHAEFTTPISFDECQRRLEIMHAKIGNKKISSTDKNDLINFKWYGSPKTFFSLFTLRPVLYGSLESAQPGTNVKVDYWYYRDPRFTTILTVVLFCLIYFLFNKISLEIALFLLGILTLSCIGNWIHYYWYRRKGKVLESHLKDALLSSTFNEEEYTWHDGDDSSYILILVLLLVILVPLCAYLELPTIMR
jgi:hypothetical protein